MKRSFSEYEHCVEKLRRMAGIETAKPKSIREALRDNSFHDTIQEAGHCRLLDGWSLSEQTAFIESLAGLTDMQKRVRVHEMAYRLHRTHQATPHLV